MLTRNFSQTPKKNLQRKSVSFGENENEHKTTDSKPATGSILKSNLKPQPTNNKSLDDFLDDFSDKDDPLDGLLSSESEAKPVPPASGCYGTKKNNQSENSDEDSLLDFGGPKNPPKQVQPEKSVEPTPSKTNISNQDFGATGLSFSDEDSLLDFGGPKNPPKKMQPKKSESKPNEPAKSESKRVTISDKDLKDDGISGAAGLGLGFTDDESDLTLTDQPVKEKPKRAVSPVQEENNDDWLNDLLGKPPPVVHKTETKPDRNTKLIQESLDFSGKSIDFSDDDTEQFLIQKKKEKVSAKKEEPIINEVIKEESVPENIQRPIRKEKTPPFEIPAKRPSVEKPKQSDFIPVKDISNQSMNLEIEKLRLENENLRISLNSVPNRQSNDSDSVNGEIQKLRHRIEIMTSGIFSIKDSP